MSVAKFYNLIPLLGKYFLFQVANRDEILTRCLVADYSKYM